MSSNRFGGHPHTRAGSAERWRQVRSLAVISSAKLLGGADSFSTTSSVEVISFRGLGDQFCRSLGESSSTAVTAAGPLVWFRARRRN